MTTSTHTRDTSRRRRRRSALIARRRGFELLERRNLLTTVTLLPQQDTTLYEDSGGALANGAGEYLFVGTVAPRNNGLVRRGLIQFDLSEIPAGSSVNSVSLSLNMSRSIAGPEPVSLHFVENSWGEGTSQAAGEEGRGTPPTNGDATWLHRSFATQNWDTPGGDFSTARSATTSVDGPGEYVWTDPDMVLDVEHWIENPEENFGWILLGNEDTDTTAKRFDSRENSVEGNRPRLTIDFTSAIPALGIGDASITEGDFGTSLLRFPVSLSRAPAQDVTVQIATTDGSATAGADYEPVNGAITFTPAGPLSQDVTVRILGDMIHEGDETFTMSLVAPNDVLLEDGEAVGTITNDDSEPEIVAMDASIQEGDTGTSTAAWTIELSRPSAFEVAVDYATSPGTAQENIDFTATAGTLTFPPGETSRTIEVEIIGDTEGEDTESFTVRLSNPNHAQLASDTASMEIIDNDSNGALPTLSISDAAALEGDQGTTELTFVVTLSESPVAEVRVDFSTAAGSATEGIDYEARQGTLVFSPGGPLTQNIVVNVIGDFTTETDETFTLSLTNANGARIDGGQAEGRIRNEDPEPEVSITNVSLDEGDAELSFASLTVELSRPSALSVTVDYTTLAATAQAGEDFIAASGQLNFAPGVTFQRIEIGVNGDQQVEPDETFSVRLSSAFNARLTAANSGTVTIVNDDQEVPLFPWHNVDLPEDVTGDGLVVPLDALRVINWLNSVGAGPLPAPTPDNQPPPFLDVNGDNEVSPIDALRVINRLNQQTPLVARTATHAPPSSTPSTRALDGLLARWAIANFDAQEDAEDRAVPHGFVQGRLE